MEWIKKVEEKIRNKEKISLIWFIEELEIIIEPYKEDSVVFFTKHATFGFGENEIISIDSALKELKQYEKPDMGIE